MEFGDLFSYVLTALGGGGISGLFFWRWNKRQKVAEVKGDEIGNMGQMIESVYKPIIENLTEQIDKLKAEVQQLRMEKESERDAYEKQIAEINKNCAEKSEQLKSQILELAAELAKKKDKQPRNAHGKYVKEGK